MKAERPELQEQFDTPEQQKNAATLGMWAFLATEVLFFGVLFLAYGVYRWAYPEDFTQAAKEFNLTLGTINTAVLLTSSFFMAAAVSYAELGRNKVTSISLIITWSLGFIFLLLKGYEYYDDVQKNIVPTPDVVIQGAGSDIARMIYLIYYIITGVHGVHVTIGLVVIAVIIWRNYQNEYSKSYYTPVELTGLYWHFVDIVWVFIYPLIYLVGRTL